MAKVHVLDQNKKLDTARVVYHIAIPNVNNSAGFSYRAAIVEYLDPDGSGIVSAVPNLATKDATEFAGLQDGSVFEETHIVEFDANLTDGQKASEIDIHYLTRESSTLSDIQNRLKYWGLDRNPT